MLRTTGHYIGVRSAGVRRPSAVFAATIVLAVALTGNASVAPASTAGSANASPCPASGLVMWVNSNGAGTAGSFYFHLELVNMSGHTCTLDGYPGVSAVSLDGARIGSPAVRESTGTPHAVTLGPSAETMAIIHVTDVGIIQASSCQPTTAAGFRVYPPGSTTSKVAPYVFRTCAKVGVIAMRVRAIKTEPEFDDLYL